MGNVQKIGQWDNWPGRKTDLIFVQDSDLMNQNERSNIKASLPERNPHMNHQKKILEMLEAADQKQMKIIYLFILHLLG
jgi:hypothetical protein